jgi:hypothetical protein
MIIVHVGQSMLGTFEQCLIVLGTYKEMEFDPP